MRLDYPNLAAAIRDGWEVFSRHAKGYTLRTVIDGRFALGEWEPPKPKPEIADPEPEC